MPISHDQDEVLAESLSNPQSFWQRQADQLTWHKKPSCALRKQTKELKSGIRHQHWTWFPDGEISTTENCLDRHVKNGHGKNVAVIYDSPVTGRKEIYTYEALLDEVEVLAGALREQGVKKGDVVLVYSTRSIITAWPALG
jgi:propionyl-CoA synthetase